MTNLTTIHLDINGREVANETLELAHNGFTAG